MRLRSLASLTCSIIVGLGVMFVGRPPLIAQERSASSSPESSQDMVIVDGMSVPDIGPMPAFAPMPPGNVNYAQKVELGKQLYFDGRLSKNNAIS